MRPLRVVLVVFGLLLASGRPVGVVRPPVSVPAPGNTIAQPPAIAPDQLLVGFRPEVGEGEREAIIARHGGRTIERLAGVHAVVVALPPGRPLGEVARGYAAEAAVRYAEPDYLYHANGTPDDPLYGDSGLWGLGAIGAPTAWETTTGSDNVVVGVVDTGIDYDHPDLAANIWKAPDGWNLPGYSCGVGTHGYRAINGVTGCDPRDDQGHGTHVAGTIGAVGNNGIGVVGVNWRVRLMALKCLNAQGLARSSDAAQVIAYAIAAKQAGVNLRVLNMSWTDTSPSQTLLAAIDNANAVGILVVAAAGDRAFASNNDQVPQYPASYAVAPYFAPNVIAVTALDRFGTRGTDANIGPTSVHVGAPGLEILSTLPGNGYGSLSGTSMAAAHVSGAAALTLAAVGSTSLDLAGLRARLLYCGDSLHSLQGRTVTGRQVNVARAIANTDCAVPQGYLLTTRTAPDAAGSVAVSPAGTTYQAGTVVNLTATPAGGYLFSGWRVNRSAIGAENPLVLTMSADRLVEAIFVPQTFLLSLSATVGGQATAPAGPAYQSGTEVALTAVADQGYLFTGWTVDGLVVGSENPLLLTMGADHTVVAAFAPAPPQGTTYALALSTPPGGSVAAVPASGPYTAGSRVVLTASPDADHVFTGWTIDGLPGGAANPYTLTMAANRAVVANFALARVLNLSNTSGGSVAVSAAGWSEGSPYPDGTVLTLTATTASNGVFTGWTIDGGFVGWRTPLTLTMGAPHTVVANFAPRPRFDDLPPGPPPYEAISQLAARGIIHGYADGAFGATDTTLRAQMAALIVRALAWDAEEHDNHFGDRCDPTNPLNCVDDGLWRSVGTLAFYEVARGYGDGTFGARDPVLHIQTIAFISRAMIAKGYWTLQPDDPALYPNISADSGHRLDLATYVHYAGAPPGTTPTADWMTWATPASRGWFAQALWQALDSYFSVDRVP